MIIEHSSGSPRKALEYIKSMNRLRLRDGKTGLTMKLCKELFDNLVLGNSEPMAIPELIKKSSIGSRDREILQELFNYDPVEFESIVKDIFIEMGYSAKVTKRSGDEGIDIVLSKDNRTELVQCKRFKGNISVQVVREFFGVMIDKNVGKGYIVTTGYFTFPAKEFAEGKGIHLIDGLELAELVGSLKDDTNN